MSETLHINCGGTLVFHHYDGNKTIFLCKKCNRKVNVVTCPSYNDYKEAGLL